MQYYKVTYTQPSWKHYIIIETSVLADSKWHAIELVFNRNSSEYPIRSFYKAKLLK